VIIPPGIEGVLWPPRVLARYGPDILPLVEREYRRDLREVPPDLRKVLDEMDKKGREYLLAELQERGSPISARRKTLPRSSKPRYNTKVTADKLKITPRAVQYQVAQGKLKATRSERGDLLFDAATVDRLAKEVK
jgi:hypothetical protein